MDRQIGEIIAARRKELGLTQEELALRVGYKSKSTINKIELGINQLRQKKIVAFADALDTTPSYLMGWTDTPGKKSLSDSLVEAFDNADPETQEAVLELLEIKYG